MDSEWNLKAADTISPRNCHRSPEPPFSPRRRQEPGRLPYVQLSAGLEPKNSEESIWKATELRPGFWLNVIDQQVKSPIRFNYQKKKALVDFGVVLNGELWNRPRTAPPCGNILNSQAGIGGILYLPHLEGGVEIPAQKRLKIFHVHVDPEVLHGLLQDELGTLPAGFRSVIEGENTRFFCRGKMDPAVQTVAHQIMRGPIDGVPWRLFLEAKAMELISLQIAWMGARQGRRQTRPALSPSEKNRIREARDILIQEMASPPTLSQLSSRLCLSVGKLENGFRDLFNTTVFGFLKEYKMQRARQMFEKADANVSEVAWAVGYVNLSHFSRAYKKRFGILPKQYLQAVRRHKVAA